MRGDGGVAGEGRVVGIPKVHYWGKCTMPLTISTQIGCPTLPLASLVPRPFRMGGAREERKGLVNNPNADPSNFNN